jgi:GT2 family glycosyltransferase
VHVTLGGLDQRRWPDDPDGDDYLFEGHVDFLGYHATAEGWLFGGWIAHPWPLGNRPEHVVAHFADAIIADHSLSSFYFRADVERRGIGYVFFLSAPARTDGAFLRLEIQFSRTTHRVLPTRDVLVLNEDDLNRELRPILLAGEADSQRRKLLDLMAQGQPATQVSGFVDCYGHHLAAGGWLFCGWIAPSWRGRHAPTRVVASFERGDVGGEAVAATYSRADLQNGGDGVIFFVPGSGGSLGSLCSISFDLDAARATVHAGPSVQRLREHELVGRLRPLLTQGPPDSERDVLLGLLSRRPYVGEDTLTGLSDPVLLEIDEAILCEPDGLLLMGWHLAMPGAVRDIRVRCGPLAAPLGLDRAIRIARPDVVAAFAAQHGADDPRCGFVAFVPQSVIPGARIYIEVETARREVGFRGVPRPKLQGLAAIRRVLEGIDVRFGEVPRAFDNVIGPAVELLNRSRLANRPVVDAIEYGPPLPSPRFSVIVPLYGRLDFAEYQLALFSEHSGAADIEFIYVLDDPPRRQEAQFLCASVYERFRVPFRLLLLDRNVGFAPASNIGLAHARGSFIAFLNSDVFPCIPDWLERLADRLDSHPDLGMVGGLLLFEDGSVQHQGMRFRRLREFGDWFFPVHEGKGLRHVGGGGLRRCISITGACMVMERALAVRMGGFDEIYAIGDFEDSDLCLKLRALGYGCAVDTDVRLYHLERKSQASSAATWRLNLTIYNAWQHQRRWAATIAENGAECDEAEPAPRGH